MITAVLCLVLSKRDKDMAVVVSLVACCMMIYAALACLDRIVSFFYQLQRLANLDEQMLKILLKSVAVGVIAQIAELVCSDSGNAALGKTLQFLATSVILYLCLPLMNSLLDMIGKVLGGG